MPRNASPLLGDLTTIYRAAAASDDGQRCMVAPAPKLSDKIAKELQSADKSLKSLPQAEVHAERPKAFGLNDGLIIPGTEFPLGAPPSTIRNAAADRAPLRGALRVIVILVDFSDKKISASKAHFEELFFSQGKMATGSVRDYYKEVSNGLIDIQGEVVGPYRLPKKLSEYANGASGMGSALPNARTMARDAAKAADPAVNFAPYDNDGNGFVDAFIVVHAGSGAEQTGKAGDIWSHKWVLDGGAYATDTTQIFGYLTIPEDGKVGVCAHELGHLLFGWPDLYDTDNSSEGIGSWCLMAAGSWNGSGDRPAHPSAWCKVGQEWVTVANQTANAAATIGDVKDSHTVHRLWRNGEASQEYFLVENRQKAGFDDKLPSGGLLIWHIDDAIATNTDENHPKVALEQADGKRDLEGRKNRGDAGDPYPGSSGNRGFDGKSTPNSNSYAGSATCVAVTDISEPGPTMTARLSVRCRVKFKELKEFRKDNIKDTTEKERLKELIDTKRFPEKRPEKPDIDKTVALDKPGDLPREFERPPIEPPFGRSGSEGEGSVEALEARLAALEARLGQVQPFISSELRPDLSGGAYAAEGDVAEQDQDRLESRFEKRLLDVPPAMG
ncbi:MAG TPA: M6 family metalloprotease domain-containing protein [Solirubrobacterales bacterium]